MKSSQYFVFKAIASYTRGNYFFSFSLENPKVSTRFVPTRKPCETEGLRFTKFSFYGASLFIAISCATQLAGTVITSSMSSGEQKMSTVMNPQFRQSGKLASCEGLVLTDSPQLPALS